MKKKVVKIETLIPNYDKIKKTKVAAYARVSTEKDEQLNSLSSQKDYFVKFIESRVSWEFVGIYYDEGISGLSSKKRDGFNQMIEDALQGKIDLIITKSISRFARNTLDSLKTIRLLKEKGIGIYFQKENIDTLDSKGEFALTLMASFAQEESRSISENCTWGQRKRFSDGKATVPFSQFIGYDRGENGNFIINHKESRVIKYIYSLAILKYSRGQIVRKLEKYKVPPPGGGNKWHPSTVARMLTNEKYKGDALLQKSFTVNYLTKEKKINEGELPMYYVENHHEAIIPREVHDYLQKNLEVIMENIRRPLGLSAKIVCSKCGAYFGSFTIHQECNGGKQAWRCGNKYSKTDKCDIRHLYESEVHKSINCAIKEIVAGREDLHNIVADVLNLEGLNEEKQEKVKVAMDKIKESDFMTSCEDMESIISKIIVDVNHDASFKFIDGSTANCHIYGTGKRPGRKKSKL